MKKSNARRIVKRAVVTLVLFLAGALVSQAHPEHWPETAAQDWYVKQGWLVGSNYIPATAINQLEMWQADTFDPKQIDLELGWAESLGMNTMRVFLHDLLWQQDSEGFRKRINTFLKIAQRHHIKPLFVLFDSCWDPNPHLGKQHAPVPGVHNSGWVQSPGAAALKDPSQYSRLEKYVKGVVGAFAKDDRILGWDLWNEPDGISSGDYRASEPPDKVQLVIALLPKVFDWARSARPAQPLTSGVWQFKWSSQEIWNETAKIQIEQSDVLSFHSYDNAEGITRRIVALQAFHRPILCTEYMARSNGSTFQNGLPTMKKYNVAAYNWGLVAGKTQTYFPWDSWQKPYINGEPKPWFHDVFRTDGQPYDPEEIKFIREITAAPSR